jgi:hypothetical protein
MNSFTKWLPGCLLLIATAVSEAQQSRPVWSVRADGDSPPFTAPGMAFISGSSVLLADNDVMQIVRIDSTGKVTQRFGGKGGGPGEFRSISWMGSGTGDSIYVWDGQLRRLSVFSAGGAFVRTELPEHTLQRPMVFGRMANGHWLVVTRTEREQRINGTDVTQTFLQVGSAPTVRQAPTPLAEVPSKRHVGIKKGDFTEFRELPAMDMSYVAACDNGFLVGAGAAREIRAYERNGRLVRAIQARREPTTFTGGARTRTIESWAGVRSSAGGPTTDPATAAAFAKAFDAAMPRSVTFTEQFAIGADRSLWLAPGGGVDAWQRLGNDGAGKPVLDLPKGAWPVSINERFVLAKWYGDEERVELWPRPRATAEPAPSALSFLGTCRTILTQ